MSHGLRAVALGVLPNFRDGGWLVCLENHQFDPATGARRPR